MVTIKDAQKTVNEIVKVLNPLSIVVFGSIAKNGRGNDLDLFVITNGFLDRREENHLLHKSLRKFREKFGIDSFAVPANLFTKYYNEGSPLLESITKEGIILYMKKAINDWIKQSKEEMETAKYLLKGGYFRGACFHAQQSLEKIIKSILMENGWKLEKTHDIDFLIKTAKKLKLELDIDDDAIEFMNSIYIGRYPSEAGLLPLGEPSEEDAEKAVKITDYVYKKIIKMLPPLKN